MSKNPVVSDTQAEAGIIATLIYNPTFCLHSDQLKYTHFYNKESASLYWGINQLVKQGIETIDSFNLSAIMNSNENMKSTFDKFGIDLENYINLSKSVSRNSVEEYKILVNRVLALAFKRELHKQLKKFDNICLDVDQDNISILSGDIYDAVNKLSEEYIIGREEITIMADIIDGIWEDIKADSNSNNNNFKSKIPLFNDYFDYSPTSLILVAARYKNGKSAYSLNETINLLEQGAVVGYFDTELSTKEFTVRALANLAQVNVRDIKNGSYSIEEEIRLRKSLTWIKSKKLIHIYDPSWNSEKIYTTAKMLKYKYGMNFLVYDYLKCTSATTASETYLKLGSLTNTLKNEVAGDLKIPVLSLAQLNKQNEIGDSDQIARYVSTVVYWSKKSDSEIAGMDWKKVGNYKAKIKVNRLGAQMNDDESISCVFDGNKMTIYQAPEQPKEGINL